MIRAATAPDATEAERSNAVVVAGLYQTEMDALEILMRQLFPHLRTDKTGSSLGDPSAHAAGSAYGNSVALHQQIGRKQRLLT